MQQPRKVKYRKQQKKIRHLTGKETRGCKLSFGDYGLMLLEPCWITARQIESSRVTISRKAKRGGKIWINIFPQKPITKKPAETRMGSGKGSPEYWVAEVRAGRIIFELTGVPRPVAIEALTKAGDKIPVKCKVVERSNYII